MTLSEASFPEDPTLRADLVRGESGAYTTTLTLPGGQRQTFASHELDEARSRVIAAVRAYLAEEVGHPARLRVEDPDGSWLLGIPHDNSGLVALPDPAGEQPRPRSASPPRPRPTATTPVLPSRPAPRRRAARPGRSTGGRVCRARHRVHCGGGGRGRDPRLRISQPRSRQPARPRHPARLRRPDHDEGHAANHESPDKRDPPEHLHPARNQGTPRSPPVKPTTRAAREPRSVQTPPRDRLENPPASHHDRDAGHHRP